MVADAAMAAEATEVAAAVIAGSVRVKAAEGWVAVMEGVEGVEADLPGGAAVMAEQEERAAEIGEAAARAVASVATVAVSAAGKARTKRPTRAQSPLLLLTRPPACREEEVRWRRQ